MTLLSLAEAARLIPGAMVAGDGATVFGRISTDSRTAAAGDLFVALKGDRFDAHDFLPEVAARGVSAVLATRSQPSGSSGTWRPCHARRRTLTAAS